MLLLGSPFCIQAQDTDGKKQLESLKKEISKIERGIYKERKKHSDEKKSLRKIESKLNKTNSQIHALNRKIKQNTSRISELENNSVKLEKKKQQQQKLLEKSLATAYQNGQQEQFKLLLNQQDPQSISRSLSYMNYVNDARKKQLEDFQATLQQISDEKTEMETLGTELEEEKASLAETKATLNEQKKERDKVLKKISSSISSKTKQLDEKKREQKRVQKLIDDLAAAARRSQIQKFTFNKKTGRCRLPVAGKVENKFKQWRPGGLRWEGIKIKAKLGSEVVAVAPGTVVYSDWFSTHGLLVIIDHGNGYMSLYAHNQALLQGVGNVVEAGDVIATVGNSGGLDESRLYFEVRKSGSPIDPLQWCK